jgi:hypothetical protein
MRWAMSLSEEIDTGFPGFLGAVQAVFGPARRDDIESAEAGGRLHPTLVLSHRHLIPVFYRLGSCWRTGT